MRKILTAEIKKFKFYKISPLPTPPPPTPSRAKNSNNNLMKILKTLVIVKL